MPYAKKLGTNKLKWQPHHATINARSAGIPEWFAASPTLMAQMEEAAKARARGAFRKQLSDEALQDAMFDQIRNKLVRN